MAQIASATYKTNASKAVRVPVFQLQVAWGMDADTFPTDWTTQSVDESARVKSVSWTRQLDMKGPLAQGTSPVATMTVELDNYDNRYSPFNTSSPLHSLLMASTTTAGGETVQYPQLWQVPIRLKVGFEASELLTMFTGLIDEPDEAWGVSGSRVSFRCLDVGGMLLKRKYSTELKTFVNVHDWLIYLMQIAGMEVHISAAGMDEGLFYIPYAWLDDEDIYSECSKAAASEGGYFYFNENGKSVFRNAAWWAQKADSTTSVYTFTVAKFSDITPGYDWKSVATGALVEYQGRQPGGEQVIWKSSNVIVCVPGTPALPGLTTIEARFDYPVNDVYAPVLFVDWVPINAGGMDMSDVVEWRFIHFAQRASIQILNVSHETAFISRMQLRGTALIGGPTEQVDRQVANPLVPQNVLRLSDNPYVQTKPQADLIADLAADRMQYPRLTYKINGAPAVPWLMLGDRITITATSPITTSRDAIITKLDFSWRPSARFTMNVEAVDAAGLFQYDNFFVLGTSRYNASDAVIFR